MYDTWCAESNKPEPEPEEINIDLRAVADRMIFIINFAVEKVYEFMVKAKEFDEESKSKQDANNATEKEVKDNLGWSKIFKDYNESKRNTEGIPEEYLRNAEGIPKEYPKEYPDNQGIPVNEELIEDSQKPTSDIWKSSL
jgi:hypothetical protein